MTELLPNNNYSFPSFEEEPFYDSEKSFALGVDSSIFSLAENDNLNFFGGGIISWSAATSTLSWTSDIRVTPFTSPTQAAALIQGPPAPGGSVIIENGEVAFFVMPRKMQQDLPVTLNTGTRVYQPSGTRMNDLVVFAARSGDTLLLVDGKSLKDGESFPLFGGGLGTTISPHQHRAPLIIQPPSLGVSTLDLQVTSLGDERLILYGTVGIFATGDTITGSVSATTATVSGVSSTYITVTAVAGAGFEAGENITGNSVIDNIAVSAPVGVFTVGDSVSAAGATGLIRSITGITPTSFLIAVVSGIFPVSGTLTDTTSGAHATITSTTLIGHPTAAIASVQPPSNLLIANVYRNGLLQAEGGGLDYSLNYTTGIATLARPTISTSEVFIILEEVVPTGAGSTQHQHLKLPIPILFDGTTNLDMMVSINTPSPNKLISINLYRNGQLQTETADYSIDMDTGIVTLVRAANSGEIFIADRQVE